MIDKFILKFAILIVVAITLTVAADYCHFCDGKHTVCKFKEEGPYPSCGKVLSVGLTAKEKKRVVCFHNKFRRKVASGNETRGKPGPQPPATSPMPKMKWDKELEMIAQRWANQCNIAHDDCRNVERFLVGQNFAMLGTSGDINQIKLKSLLSMWSDEVKDFNRNDVAALRDDDNFYMVGHYTQMVWSETTKIGCGAVKYNNDNKYNRFLLFCNYGPTGNYFGKPLYPTRSQPSVTQV